jgi:tetratricopeptide (TPR) repeat protein
LSALFGQWSDTFFNRADFKRALRIAAEMRELGDIAGDLPMQVLGCDCAGFVSWNLGEFTEGRAYLERALALYDPAHRPSYSELLPFDPLAYLQIHSSWLLGCLGHLDQALFRRDASLDEARRLAHPPTLAVALAATGFAGSCASLEPGSLLPYANELQALATERGLEHFRMMALIERGWSLAGLERGDEGIPLLAAGLAGLRDLGFLTWRPWALTPLGDAWRIAGQWQAALEHLGEAQRRAQETTERWFLAETLRLTGDVLLATGDPAAAEASYHEALAFGRQLSAKLWELRAATSLGRLWRDQGKHAAAHALLSHRRCGLIA